MPSFFGRRIVARGHFGDGGVFRGCGPIFPFLPGPEFLVSLFQLIPLMALVENGRKADDQQKRDKKNHGAEFGAIGFHIRAAVPTGSKIDDDGYNE